jgi:hypothetical protein
MNNISLETRAQMIHLNVMDSVLFVPYFNVSIYYCAECTLSSFQIFVSNTKYMQQTVRSHPKNTINIWHMSSCCALHLRDSTVLVNYDDNCQDYMLSIIHEHSYEYAAMAQ